MNIAEFSIKNRVLSVIVILVTVFGGWTAYQTMPRFEDPEFLIRTAQIVTTYPGASATEVADEVSEALETAIQQMQEVDEVKSTSTDGVSTIQVDIKFEFAANRSELQVVWGILRSRVADAQRSLPPGAGPSVVYDNFGDVYGFYYLLTGDGYSPAEMRRYARDLQRELLQVEGVARVALDGDQREAIFVEISRERSAAVGVSQNQIYAALDQQNSVTSAGTASVGEQRIRIAPTGELVSVESIANILLATSDDGALVRIGDVADIYRDYPRQTFMTRLDDESAIAIGIAAIAGSNVVAVGEAITDALVENESRRPIGMELTAAYHQGDIVDAAIKNFAFNVMLAVAIVFVTLLIFMGPRSGAVMGAVLMMTIMATLATMYVSGIPMHRISLGALIIALGMMVDNAIVVTDGILVGTQRGQKVIDIASKVVRQTMWPLLGGTIVGIIAFAPIGFAPGSTGEYTKHLFWVILIALGYSWIFAITLTPLFCHWAFKPSAGAAVSAGPGPLTRAYAGFMRAVLFVRWPLVAVVVGVFATSVWAFQFVPSGFFPASTTPQLVIDYSLPQGTSVERTNADIREINEFVMGLDNVEYTRTTVGGGTLRFMLIYSGKSPDEAYGQIIATVEDYHELDAMMPGIQEFIDNRFPDGQAKIWRFVLGPGGGSKIEAVFQGPDTGVLRTLSDQAVAIMRADPTATAIRNTWGEPVPIIEPLFSDSRASRAGVSREDISSAIRLNYDGETVGVYREGDDLLQIIARAPASERRDVNSIRDIQVLSTSTGRSAPIEQVVDGFRTTWREGRLEREDRVLTIKAQSDPTPGVLASELQARLAPQIEAIELPPGYTMEWGGEAADSADANSSLASTIPLGLMAMVIVVFVLFNAVRQPIVIWLIVPLSIIGVVVGLLVTNTALEFMAILGVLSLSGLLIKNAIVLVDQINVEIVSGKPRFDSVVDSAVSRVRPVMMGTLTTMLGVLPLFGDVFFKSMAVVLVFGLGFATLLTLIVAPVLYAIFFGIKRSERALQEG